MVIGAAPPPDSQTLSYHTHSITSLPDLEHAHDRGPLRDWDALMRADPAATFFQGPAWCMAWYRSHDDLFQPLTLVVTCHGRLVGMVPLAIERSTRRLTFASDGMADYRDVVAIPGYRKVVIVELLRICREGDFLKQLQLGPIPPHSETLRVLAGCAAAPPRVCLIVRYHTTWRWWFRDAEAVRRLTSKESVRRHLSYYKRQGPVVLERIDTNEAWERIKQDFFDQHSLRQLYTDRPLCFNNPRNRAFYDALFRSSPSDIHLTILRVGDRLLAMHYGYISNGMLYWGAPAFDIREERHSPGQILLALLIQSAESSGLRGVDLTVGIEEFKKRFSNEHAQLPTVEVYARARQYYARRLRDGAVRFAKASVVRLLSRHTWERVRTSCLSLTELYRRRPITTTTAPLHSRHEALRRDKTWLIFVAGPGHVRDTDAPSTGARYLLRENSLADLLKYDDADRMTALRVAAAVKEAAHLIPDGHTLHTMLANDELVGWGWSCVGKRPVSLPEGETRLEIEPTSSSLYGLYVIPTFRTGPAHRALLAGVLNESFAQGAQRAYTVCCTADAVSRTVIEQVGFRLSTPTA